MPYASVSEVPKSIPKDNRKQWLEIWNSIYAARIKAGDSKEESERRAFAGANSKAGPNSKAMTEAEFRQVMKGVGTKTTGFARAVDGPCRCGHCKWMDKKKVGGNGVCTSKEVNADPALKDEPRDHEDLLIVAPGDWCEKDYEPVEKEKSMKTRTFSKFIPFCKIDEAKREAWGIVTCELPDKDNEVCDYLKSKPYYQAVIDEMGKATDGENYFPLREMHQLSAAGKCIGFDFRDNDKEIFMGFKVVDDAAWDKVLQKVYTGFSQGGKIVEMYPDSTYEDCKRYVADPSEISLVDNPCLAEAHFAYVKADGSVELRKFGKVLPPAPAADSLVNKGLRSDIEMLKAKIESLSGIAKAKTKRVAGEDLPSSAFLIVGDENDPSSWKLPVKFSSDKKSKSHVRNALARFSQLKDVSQADKDKAWKKLVSLAEKYDIEVEAEKKKLAAIQSYLRKRARVLVAQISRKIAGGNVGYPLAMLDNDLGKLAKSLWDVGRLAEIVQALSYMCYNQIMEEELEEDADSPLPSLLAENVDTLLDTLLQMVEEEAQEVRDDLHSRVR